MKKIVCYLIIITFLLSIFNNFNNLSAYQSEFRFSSNNYDYVIITSDDLIDSINSFQLWKKFLGLNINTVTISSIKENYQGIDIQQQIRNFLIEKYNEWNIKFVLLIGSRETIPMREIHTIPSEFEEGYGSLYSDFYYADLNGDWDFDNDGLYGEYKHDKVDFYPEINIGRIPSDDPDVVNEILKRSIRYESDKGSWKKNVLMLGSIIYYNNLESFNHIYNRSDGATLMEKCRTDIFEPNDYQCTCMYEKEGIRPSTFDCEYPLTYTNVLSEWTNNYAIVNMLGHANERIITRFIWDHDDGDYIPEISENELYYRDFLRRADSDSLQLEKPPIVFTSGCSQLYSSNNFGRSFIEDGAATAFIGSTDLALYNITKIWNDERDGGVFSICYYFFKYFIDEKQKCGEALSNSKTFFYEHFWFNNESNYEWIWRCYSTIFGFTLYGDPALNLIYKRKGDSNLNHQDVIIQKIHMIYNIILSDKNPNHFFDLIRISQDKPVRIN